MEVELVTLVNLLLCLAIVIMGTFGYMKSKHKTPLRLAVVFGLFAVSHALVMFDVSGEMDMVVFAIRVVAYSMVIFLLYRYIQILDIF